MAHAEIHGKCARFSSCRARLELNLKPRKTNGLERARENWSSTVIFISAMGLKSKTCVRKVALVNKNGQGDLKMTKLLLFKTNKNMCES